MYDFNVLDIVMDEVRFCRSMNIQITKIILGTKAFINVREKCPVTDPIPTLTRSPEPNTFQGFLFGIPVKIVEGGNPWAIGFERKPIQRN